MKELGFAGVGEFIGEFCWRKWGGRQSLAYRIRRSFCITEIEEFQRDFSRCRTMSNTVSR